VFGKPTKRFLVALGIPLVAEIIYLVRTPYGSITGWEAWGICLGVGITAVALDVLFEWQGWLT
jgi:hypothetical protein